MSICIRCRSHAINHHRHGRDGSDPDLCDVCYWRKRADDAADIEREACAKIAEQHEEGPGGADAIRMRSKP